MSPYPTVVMVTTAHQNASGMDLKNDWSEPASAKYTVLENSTTPGKQHAQRQCRCPPNAATRQGRCMNEQTNNVPKENEIAVSGGVEGEKKNSGRFRDSTHVHYTRIVRRNKRLVKRGKRRETDVSFRKPRIGTSIVPGRSIVLRVHYPVACIDRPPIGSSRQKNTYFFFGFSGGLSVSLRGFCTTGRITRPCDLFLRKKKTTPVGVGIFFREVYRSLARPACLPGRANARAR